MTKPLPKFHVTARTYTCDDTWISLPIYTGTYRQCQNWIGSSSFYDWVDGDQYTGPVEIVPYDYYPSDEDS
jgi:hypothetical protein